MTLETAEILAKYRLPVLHRGIVYSRIIYLGHTYPIRGERQPVVTLLDKNRNSMIQAAIADCEPAESFTPGLGMPEEG